MQKKWNQQKLAKIYKRANEQKQQPQSDLLDCMSFTRSQKLIQTFQEPKLKVIQGRRNNYATPIFKERPVRNYAQCSSTHRWKMVNLGVPVSFWKYRSYWDERITNLQFLVTFDALIHMLLLPVWLYFLLVLLNKNALISN